MTHTAELIVLNLTKIKDSAAVVHCLSGKWGRRSFIVSTGKTSPISLFLPLNIIEAEVIENKRSDLWRIRNIKATEPLSGIRGNIARNSMTLFISEVLFRFLKEGQSDNGLYLWCRKSILCLDSLERGYASFHLRFLVELAGILGFAPSAGELAPFDERYGDELKILCEGTLAEALALPLTGKDRNEIAGILLRYLSYHTESDVCIKSLKVLRELFI